MGTRRSRWRAALTSPTGVAAVVLLVLLALTAVLAPILVGDAASTRDATAINKNPTAAHWAGTDGLGRDIFARVLVATRTSLLLALAVTAIAVVGGLLLGLLPAVLARRAGRLVVSIIDLLLGFPGLLVVLIVATVVGIGAKGAVISLGLATIPAFARIVHTNAAAVAARDYVAAARTLGVGRVGVVRTHVLPNVAEPLVVAATLVMSGALLAFGGLSFLGLGVQPPSFDWGRMLDEGLDRIYVNPAAAITPAVPLVLSGLAFALLGEVIARAVGGSSLLAVVRPGRRAAVPTAPGATMPVTPPSDGARGVAVDARGLRVGFATGAGRVDAVDGITLRVAAGESVGIVGESGSGKTLTAMAIAGVPPTEARVDSELLDVAGVDLRRPPDAAARRRLGAAVAVVFQNPTTSLNPAMRVGAQLAELGRVHLGLDRRAAAARAVARLRHVRIPSPERRARQYPHELSGGMNQRAMIALGIMGSPELLIADEPTTALDVTVQRQVLELLAEVRAESGAALLFISHDMAVVSQVCERVVVMYAGRIVEDLPAAQLTAAAHPYTRRLLATVPDMTTSRAAPLATIPGRPPEPARRPAGCAFAPRCERATSACDQLPPLTSIAAGHTVACWHPVGDDVQVGR